MQFPAPRATLFGQAGRGHANNNRSFQIITYFACMFADVDSDCFEAQLPKLKPHAQHVFGDLTAGDFPGNVS